MPLAYHQINHACMCGSGSAVRTPIEKYQAVICFPSNTGTDPLDEQLNHSRAVRTALCEIN